jgi:hypothetical protein
LIVLDLIFWRSYSSYIEGLDQEKMKKTIDQILTEKSEKEAREQLQPWKEKMEALFLEADLLVKPPKTAQYFPSTYIRDVDIAYPGTMPTLRSAVKTQEIKMRKLGQGFSPG